MSSRPIIDVTIQDKKYRALIDTGATAPAWIASEKYLSCLIQAKKHKDKVWISGFGGNGARKNLYIISSMKIGKLTYTNIPIIASEISNNNNFHLVLPAKMFRKMVYTINNINHKITIQTQGLQSNIKLIRNQSKLV